jgi:histidyl-tRNA synthetase
MSLSTQPYKGARDFYPEDKRIQKYMFGVLRKVVESFGYQEYDAPILEPLDIYLAKSGEEIVNQQLYSFEDKGIPNLWRYERPQAGRLREHWQLNVDLFGVANLSADHEIIKVADSIMKAFGAPADSYVIRINSRQLVDRFLKDYLKLTDEQVYETSKLIDRWHKIERQEFHDQARQTLGEDNKYQELVQLMESKDLDSLPAEVRDDKSAQELKKLVAVLNNSDVKNAVFDFSVIRGMDYYGGIVFEVFDTNPENIRSMFGGGRYDGLVSLFDVEPLPTVGFGMGDVTLQRFLEVHNLLPKLEPETQLTVVLVGNVYDRAQTVLSELRVKGINNAVDSSDRKLDSQLKSAVKSGVRYALFIGEQELESSRFKLKDLEKGEEKELSLDEIVSTLSVNRDN